jgi:hypothetical protein
MTPAVSEAVSIEIKQTSDPEDLKRTIARCLLIAARRGRAIRLLQDGPQRRLPSQNVPLMTLSDDNPSHGGLDHHGRSEQTHRIQHPIHPLAHPEQATSSCSEGQ